MASSPHDSFSTFWVECGLIAPNDVWTSADHPHVIILSTAPLFAVGGSILTLSLTVESLSLAIHHIAFLAGRFLSDIYLEWLC